MKPLRIHIQRIVDFGTIVSLIGVDIDVDQPITIHVDHRPFASFWEAWREAGFPQPIEYAADRLTLQLEMLPDEDAHEVQLIDGGNMLVQNETQATNANNAPLSIGEIEP
jgi:hypothetical protein